MTKPQQYYERQVTSKRLNPDPRVGNPVQRSSALGQHKGVFQSHQDSFLTQLEDLHR